MDRKQLEIISFNAQMAGHGDTDLEGRLIAQQQASLDIAEAYSAVLPEDAELPDDFVEATDYATDIVYRLGYDMFGPDDIRRAIKHREDYRRKEDASWAPTDDVAIDLIVQLATVGAKLSREDDEPAFGPHRKARSRPWEILEDPRERYNKFGRPILMNYDLPSDE